MKNSSNINSEALDDSGNNILGRFNLLDLIFGDTIREIRDFDFFFLQYLGVVMNFRKYVLDAAQEIELLGMIVNSITMTLPLPPEKVQNHKR